MNAPFVILEALFKLIVTTCVGLTALIASLQNTQHKLVLPESLLNSRLMSPSIQLAQSHRFLSDGQPAEARNAASIALKKAPGFSTSWILLGASIEAAVGIEAALPYYDQAISVDRFGRQSVEFAAPKLYQHRWITLKDMTWWALRLNSAKIALALPQEAPQEWPDGLEELLHSGGLETMFSVGLDNWLTEMHKHSFASKLAPLEQGFVLAGLCRSNHDECIAFLTQCEAKQIQCPRGIKLTSRSNQAVLLALLEADDLDRAHRIGKDAVAKFRDAGSVRLYAQVLERQGKSDDARRLLRLHPAMQKY